jgi:hypothetical protein
MPSSLLKISRYLDENNIRYSQPDERRIIIDGVERESESFGGLVRVCVREGLKITTEDCVPNIRNCRTFSACSATVEYSLFYRILSYFMYC